MNRILALRAKRRTLVRAVEFVFCVATLTRIVAAQAIDPEVRHYWNSVFSDSKASFNRDPSRLLVEAIQDRKPGLALDLGMGQGRNAIFLAQQGWRTTGVDISDVAVEQAQARARQLGVNLDTVIDSADHFDLGRNRWDLIALFYMHAWYRGAEPGIVQRLYEGLKPGGLLVIEGFAGEPKFMFQTNELLRDFARLRILRYEDLQGEADWVPGRKSRIVQFVGEKTP
jgi:SAM-dependent methyltransferase